jgi:hypothetical protein
MEEGYRVACMLIVSATIPSAKESVKPHIETDHEECRFLGRGAVWILLEPTFPDNMSLHLQDKEISQIETTLTATSN